MSPTAWDLQALRLHLQKSLPSSNAGNGSASQAIAVVNSISRGVDIFRYHMATARDAIKGLIDEKNASDPEPLLLVFGQGAKQDEFAFSRLVSEANLIGCLQTARNLWDLTAQLLNLTINPSPIPEERCDLSRLLVALPSSPVRTAIESLVGSDEYHYVNGFINITKHRRLVDHALSVSFEEDRVGIRIGDFHYAGTRHAAKWGTEALQSAIGVKNQVIGVGRLLNSMLGA